MLSLRRLPPNSVVQVGALPDMPDQEVSATVTLYSVSEEGDAKASVIGEAASRAKRVLVVDDDAAIRQMVAFNLTRHGFNIDQAHDARSVQVSVQRCRPDLVIIDWMLPGSSGLHLRSLRQDRALCHVPVIILTGRTDECDKVAGLEAGADDYISKPFSIRELLARINAILRRTSRNQSSEVLRASGLALDATSLRVTLGDRTVPLRPLEFRLLSFFIANPDRVHSRTQLLDCVWGTHIRLEEHTVDVEISRLRHSLGTFNCDVYIQTVHGAGYRFSTLHA